MDDGDRRQGVGSPPGHPAVRGNAPGCSTCRRPTRCPKGRFSFSLFRDNLDRDPKDEDISIHGISLGYGFSNRVEIFGNFGLQNRLDADALFQPGYVNDYPFVSTPWETGRGDLKVGIKFGFLNDYAGDPVGLALRGVVKIPTADEDLGLGTGKVSWGGDLTLSKSLDEKADIHLSVGYTGERRSGRRRPRQRLQAGRGHQHPRLHLAAAPGRDHEARNYTGDSDFEQTNPLDLVIGPGALDQARLLHPSRDLLEPQLRRPRAGPEQQELDRPSHLDRLSPRLGLPRDRRARAAAAAAAVQPRADGELRDRAHDPPAG